MTTGTIDPYLKLPEDINPPKPGYFFNVFWMIHSYLNLVLNTPNPTAGVGIVKLYSYRMGVVNLDTSVLEETYIRKLEDSSKKVRTTLNEFANSMISYNLVTLYRLISNTLVADIARGFGDNACLTTETMSAIGGFCRFHNVKRSSRDQREDSIVSVVETCRYNAIYHTAGVSSVEEIIALLDTIDKLIQNPPGADEYERRNYTMNLLRIVFFVGCRYYNINLLRFNDQLLKRPYTRNLGINDFTLAAIPFDPTMFVTCADEGSSMSRFGIEYVQSLHAVLSELGGIECTVNFSANDTDNKE